MLGVGIPLRTMKNNKKLVITKSTLRKMPEKSSLLAKLKNFSLLFCSLFFEHFA